MPGAERLRDSSALADLAARQKGAGKLHAAICALGRLQLPEARGAMRALHAAAAPLLVDFTPSALCQMLEAGAGLDPGLRSPLLRQLRHLLLQRGMSLELFSAQDLAMLARFCGRVSERARLEAWGCRWGASVPSRRWPRLQS